ncbi:hypothetical protein PHSY_005784 [Pseudozyma hubeiensis SY62]|uniref:Uncharacterized protein n=1 Tax=Pseudozyma hubeiensis (strain SY62) TaxID=1305764 RepID=R9PJA0_PSEHS|nr:hypothetical protein PHSY_005784 [Pseudozyma hubeiensis SY62]GAC98195.1 hypothetical protein PHSY_005784 [Pseudozyma hubeiensis SY62]
MTAFTNSFGRFGSIRKRDTSKKAVQPIDVAAAKQYDQPGPSSAASSGLLTPRPHHYRSTTPSPATPAASTFASGSSAPSSSRIVSSPTFVSSSAFRADLEAITPPLSPVQPHSAAAARATKSPIRRALSRSFFFGSTHSSGATTSAQPAPAVHISSPIPAAAWGVGTARAPRPQRPARPVTSPATELSPEPHAFGFASSEMSRSRTAGAIMISPPADVNTRRRSSTLMAPVELTGSCEDKQRSLSSSWSIRFSRTPSPVPDAQPGTSAPSAGGARASLRSIRQRHTRKSIHSILGLSPPTTSSVPPSTTASPLRRRLTRCASEESFHCRGPGFDAPPAADTRPSVDEDSLDMSCLRPRPAAAVPRCVSLYSSSYPADLPSSGARRMSEFTIDAYEEATEASDEEALDRLGELELEANHDSDYPLAGLGLTDSLPATPRVAPKRLSATSQISLAESIPTSIASSSTSSLSLSSVGNHLGNSIPSMQNWYSTCPPTPPSSIRLRLAFRSLPSPSPAVLIDNAVEKGRPISSVFISSNSSVLDLKETISARMREVGYRISPRNLTLTLHLSDDVAKGKAKTALGVMLEGDERKVLDDSGRMLFEEGVQEDDLVVVECDPAKVLWCI